MMYRNKFLIVSFTVSVSVSETDFDRAKIKLTCHFDRRLISRYFEPACVCLFVIVFAATTGRSIRPGRHVGGTENTTNAKTE